MITIQTFVFMNNLQSFVNIKQGRVTLCTFTDTIYPVLPFRLTIILKWKLYAIYKTEPTLLPHQGLFR